MNNGDKVSMATGIVSGPISKEEMVCQYIHMVSSKGFWFDHLYKYSFPTLLAQLVLIFFATRLVYFLLKPLQQSVFTAQIIAGIILGPTFLGRYLSNLPKLFNTGSIVVLQMVANLGFILHMFLLGVQMDSGMFRKAGSSAVLIGSAGFILSYALGGLTYTLVDKFMTLDQELSRSLKYVMPVTAMSSFPVITSLLSDLRILNSELGRLAASISMVCDLCGLVMSAILKSLIASRGGYIKFGWLWSICSGIVFLITIVFILRPFIIWLTKITPEGKPLRKFQLIVIIVIVLWCALCTEVIGHHAAVGPFILGIALPDGPPLGTFLVHKLDIITNDLFLPVFVVTSGFHTDLISVGREKYLEIAELVIIVGYIGKFTGTLLPAICCSVSFRDAISLSLIMCCKGVVEVGTYNMWKDRQVIDDRSFSLLLITMLIVTGLARPAVQYLYDPSRRYSSIERKSILHSNNSNQLRILVCIHDKDNVPSAINLLEASNPNRFSPISIFVLHLMELKGRAAPILVPHYHLNKLTSRASHSDHIVNAYRIYEQHHQGSAVVQHFSVVAPYASMHNDICTVALEKRTHMVIIPFHKQWLFNKEVGTPIASIRKVNLNVIKKAPCSVGILVEKRSKVEGNVWVITGRSLCRIALFFLGGPDDWEALAYGRRMATHSNISFTVVRFQHKQQDKRTSHDEEQDVDNELIRDFRATTVCVKGQKNYKEVNVKDAIETMEAICSMKDDFDLVMAGRRHKPDSPFTLGLTTEWSEFAELGIIGDILASSNFSFSVLVVQIQSQEAVYVEHLSITCPRNTTANSKTYTESSMDEDCTPVHSKAQSIDTMAFYDLSLSDDEDDDQLSLFRSTAV